MLAFTKLIGFLLMPLGLLWLCLLATAWWAWRVSKRLGLVLAGLALFLALVGNVHVGRALIGWLERSVPENVVVEPLEALFVLGGGSDLDDQGRPMVSRAGDRLVKAALLWHEGKVKRLVASGVSMDERGRIRNLAEESRVIWKGMGVPEAAVFDIGEPCRNTSQELAAARRMVARTGWTRVGLLTSAWHLPRALALARKEGLTVVAVRADVQGRPRAFQLWDVIPQEEGIRCTEMAAWELLGRLAGR